jgi:hypothetical protein
MSVTDTLGSLLFLIATVCWAIAAVYAFNYYALGGPTTALGVSWGLMLTGCIPFGLALVLGWYTW